ncbi:MAG: ABC transporter ATP-binding protein [Acholeplasmatales bacterium]|jgi:ABC-2 type transport system ATP-binding protein|nr:ABC transporter ATP-binding protein [Acholeplasmatales bacterium]
MNVILNSDSVTKQYKKNVVLNNINLAILKGEIVGFVGENGAGKTTLIRLITQVAFPTSGKISRHFENDKKGSMSAIVETPSLYLGLNAMENLINQFLLLGFKINDDSLQKIHELLKLVGLEYLIGNPKVVKNFSLGMKQRLSIAFALASHPEFVILDEPMNGLDPEGIVEIRDLIKSLNQEHKITFLISSHLLNELSKVATKYCFIHKGEIIRIIYAKELENPHKSGVEIIVDNLEKGFQILKNTYPSVIVREKSIILDQDIKYSVLADLLESSGVQLVSIKKIVEDLEEYYIQLMGGSK